MMKVDKVRGKAPLFECQRLIVNETLDAGFSVSFAQPESVYEQDTSRERKLKIKQRFQYLAGIMISKQEPMVEQ